MASIFSRIIAGEIPGRFVWSDDRAIAMVDIRPLNRGHCLVIPRLEVDHWLDLDPELTDHLLAIARAVGEAQRVAFAPERVGLMIAGFEVPHVHVHVVPMDTMAHLDFANADPSPDPDDLDAVAATLVATLTDLGHGANMPD